MHVISTAAFVSVLALASTLAFALPQAKPATGPAPQQSPAPLKSSSSDKPASVPCTDTYTVPQAEPCDTLVAKLGLSQADILSLNDGLSCDGNIPAGKVLCIKKPKQKSTRALAPNPPKPAPACKTYAPATAATCDELAAEFGLTPEKFVEYNSGVNSGCTNLVPGQKYCVALD
ncbi:hypothetical protein H4582DRAFT_2103526 [Lactarius indigo]|nr:hypothetical protein H4582DRAFT_2103526 [Lactarius indigo]